MTPDRIHEIAIDIAHNVANGAVKEITDTDIQQIVGEFDDAEGMPETEFRAACKQIRELAATAEITVTFPQLYEDTTPADEDEPKFEAGRYYITENGAFVFQCNEIVGNGIALGRELRVDGLPGDASQQVYQRPGTRSLWVEIDETDVHAKYGIHGWVHRPKQR